MKIFGFHREFDFWILQALFAPRTWEGWSITTFTVNNWGRACVNVCWALPEALTGGGTPPWFLGQIPDQLN